MTVKLLVALSIGAAFVLATASGATVALSGAAADTVTQGRFVWRDLMTRNVTEAKRFYGELLGWRFEDTRRNERPYVLARAAGSPVAGIVDVSSLSSAGAQWLSFMAVADLDQTVAAVRSDGGKVLVEPRDVLPLARVAVVADPQGAPLGLAELRRAVPDPTQPSPNRFFWQEYLARDAAQALGFYTRLVGYESAVSDSRLGVEYHVLRKTRGRAGLFQLPTAAAEIQTQLAALRAGGRSRSARRARRASGRPHSGAGGTRTPKWFAGRDRRSQRRATRATEVPVLSSTS